MSISKILVTLDSMRYPNTGLYYFGKSLGEALLRQNQNQFKLTYFVDRNTKVFDDTDAGIMHLRKYHKVMFFNYRNIDLFHFTDQFSRMKPKRVSRKKILTIHDINQVHEKDMSPEKLKLYIGKLGERIDSCDRIVTISQFAANDVLRFYPHVKDKLSVIYNGADKLQVKPGHQPAYQPQKPFLFTIGIVSAKKNAHVLPALLQNNELELVIAGIETPYKDTVMEQAKKFGCADRVKIIGTINDDDRSWYYQHCEAFVFPSIAEGFGLPVIEAMHFGKPVFVSTSTSLPEVAGDAAYYFNTFDAEDMQRTFESGMQHFTQHNMAQKAMQHAARYNWDNTARQYLQLYHNCLNNK